MVNRITERIPIIIGTTHCWTSNDMLNGASQRKLN